MYLYCIYMYCNGIMYPWNEDISIIRTLCLFRRMPTLYWFHCTRLHHLFQALFGHSLPKFQFDHEDIPKTAIAILFGLFYFLQWPSPSKGLWIKSYMVSPLCTPTWMTLCSLTLMQRNTCIISARFSLILMTRTSKSTPVCVSWGQLYPTFLAFTWTVRVSDPWRTRLKSFGTFFCHPDSIRWASSWACLIFTTVSFLA